MKRKLFFLVFLCILFQMGIIGAERSKPSFHILSLDGGGVRGAFTAQLLAMLDDECHFLSKVDFFVGTSTGSILAYSLAYGTSPQDLVKLYLDHADKIFQPYKHYKKEEQRDLLKNVLPKYKNEALKKILSERFPGNLTLSALPRKAMSVSFRLYDARLKAWAPEVVDNFSEQTPTVVDAILRSSAAPLYFPSYQGCIDGGVFANNPSIAALARAIDPLGGNQKLENICLLSLGTGMSLNSVPQDVAWGPIQWVILSPLPNPPTPNNPLLYILMEGTASVAHYQAIQFLGERYFRLDDYLDKVVPLDSWQEVKYLVEAAKKVPQKNPEGWRRLIAWIHQNFD